MNTRCAYHDADIFTWKKKDCTLVDGQVKR